eukprot:565463_1
MGCCVTISPEFKDIPEDCRPSSKRAPGTWGLYVQSDEDDSEGTIPPHHPDHPNYHPNYPRTRKRKSQKMRHKHTTKYKGEKKNKKRRNGLTQKTWTKRYRKKGGKYIATPLEEDLDGCGVDETLEMQRIRLKLIEEQQQHDEEEQRIEEERVERERIMQELERIRQLKIVRERERKEREEREERERKERERKQKRARVRTNAMKELLSTEETYVSLLKECIDVFVDPLALRPDLLDDKIENGHRILFSDIKIIYGVNSAFLSDLRLKIGDAHLDNETTQIGDDFARFTPYFRAYQSYMNNYDAASMLLSRITDGAQERNKFEAFNAWYDEQRVKHCENRSLSFYLILPIQRLPRYKLCLTEIVKNTEMDHGDLNDLNIALRAISDVTMLCNNRMKEYESRCIVRDIEIEFESAYSSVDTRLVTPSRRFVKKGTLHRITRKGDERKLTFYLFNDLLCYASDVTMSMSMTKRLQMRMAIDDIFHVRESVQHNKYKGKGFQIYSAVKSIIVYAQTMNEKREWLAAITSCMQSVQNGIKYQGGTRYELSSALWIPDDWSDTCMVTKCTKRFNSITTRRHHCRWCGKLICRECGKYKLRHKIHCNSMISPVCLDCYDMHHTRFRANTSALLYYDDGAGEEEEDGEFDDQDDQQLEGRQTHLHQTEQFPLRLSKASVMYNP